MEPELSFKSSDKTDIKQLDALGGFEWPTVIKQSAQRLY